MKTKMSFILRSSVCFIVTATLCCFSFNSAWAAFKFVAYGDSRTNAGVHSDVCSEINSEDPDLVIHAGDLWDGYASSTWKKHFTSRSNLNNLLNNNKILVARGNHESESAVKDFSPPIVRNNNIRYSFLAGNVFFVCVGMDPSASYLESQLQKSESRNADFRVIFHHYPIYSGGDHGKSGKSDVEAICDKYDVTISFAGHDHHYERTKTIYGRQAVYSGSDVPANVKGTTYVVTGGGGAPLRGISSKWWKAYATSKYHYCVLTAYDDRLEMTVKNDNGAVIERFVRRKASGTVEVCGKYDGATICASGENAAGKETKDKAFDGDSATKWLTFNDSGWIQYAYPNGDAVTVDEYRITSANDSPERDPRDWQFKGSNDGKNWKTLDSRSGVTFPGRFHTRSFTFNNANPYKMYRLNISSNQDPVTANSMQLAELELLGTGGGIVDTDGDGISDASDNCPFKANSNQADKDGDGIGDVCDPVDNSGGGDPVCKEVCHEEIVGCEPVMVCEEICGTATDADGDGVADSADNCPHKANADQADKDGDGIGDACDPTDDSGGGNDNNDTGHRSDNLIVHGTLSNDEYLVSPNGAYRFYLQGDGNLVLRNRSTGQALWSSGTHDQGGDRFILQGDGNLVLYTAANAPLWDSKTVGSGATILRLNDDGSLVLYRGTTMVWSVNRSG